jgi:hypothetical protein
MGDVDGGVEVLQGFKASKPRLRSGSRVCDQACFCLQEYPAVEGIQGSGICDQASLVSGLPSLFELCKVTRLQGLGVCAPGIRAVWRLSPATLFLGVACISLGRSLSEIPT